MWRAFKTVPQQLWNGFWRLKPCFRGGSSINRATPSILKCPNPRQISIRFDATKCMAQQLPVVFSPFALTQWKLIGCISHYSQKKIFLCKKNKTIRLKCFVFLQTQTKQGAALHTLFNQWSFVKISLGRHHALMVEDGTFSHMFQFFMRF